MMHSQMICNYDVLDDSHKPKPKSKPLPPPKEFKNT